MIADKIHELIKNGKSEEAKDLYLKISDKAIAMAIWMEILSNPESKRKVIAWNQDEKFKVYIRKLFTENRAIVDRVIFSNV